KCPLTTAGSPVERGQTPPRGRQGPGPLPNTRAPPCSAETSHGQCAASESDHRSAQNSTNPSTFRPIVPLRTSALRTRDPPAPAHALRTRELAPPHGLLDAACPTSSQSTPGSARTTPAGPLSVFRRIGP